jgi:hypothetical protein
MVGYAGKKSKKFNEEAQAVHTMEKEATKESGESDTREGLNTNFLQF